MASKHIAVVAGLTGTPSSVTASVYSETGASLATIPNASIVQVASSDVYLCDLRNTSVTGSLALPDDGDPEEKSYVLIWTDDQSNRFVTLERVKGQQGREQIARRFEQREFVYPGAPVPARNITQAMIDDGAIDYEIAKASPGLSFGSPVDTWYLVYHYNANTTLQKIVPQLSAP